jgi:DNA-binding NarL/FixJ family response regulator
MIRVLVADDHDLFREGLKQLLRDDSGINIAGEASTGDEAVKAVAEGEFDIVLLDISMPGMHWLEVMAQIHHAKPTLPILILTMHPEEQYAIRALRAGAAGYLTKKTASSELLAAIRRVTEGRRYVTTSLAEQLASYLSDGKQTQPHEMLTDREYQVMCLIASGNTITQVSESLDLSVKTISTYRTRLLRKMGLANNAELIRYVLEHELLTS